MSKNYNNSNSKPRQIVVKPRNKNQELLIKSIEQNDVTFGIGPAGTGKTLVSSHLALKYLQEHKHQKIIFSRPAVSADEDLGFLPGSLQDKLDPYMFPIYDALSWYLQPEAIQDMLKDNIIEVASVGFMRGRSFYNSFVVIDEAQNLTKAQMKMVLTRFGEGCKMVINGDLTQCDLFNKNDSGLLLAYEIFKKNTEGVGLIEFENKDIERHPVVGRILTALEGS